MSLYHKSEERIMAAEAALRRGDDAAARVLHREAGVMQKAWVDALPADRSRTKAIFGASAAALFYRAGDLEDAEHQANALLATPSLDGHTAGRLRELLTAIGEARVKASGPA